MTNDEAMKLARLLIHPPFSYAYSAMEEDGRKLAQFILSGDMRREIENAAFERAQKAIRALEKPESDYDNCDDERAGYLLGYDDAVEAGCQEIQDLIQPPAQPDGE